MICQGNFVIPVLQTGGWGFVSQSWVRSESRRSEDIRVSRWNLIRWVSVQDSISMQVFHQFWCIMKLISFVVYPYPQIHHISASFSTSQSWNLVLDVYPRVYSFKNLGRYFLCTFCLGVNCVCWRLFPLT